MTIDHDRVRRLLAALDALIQTNPQLRAPAARRRLAAELVKVQREPRGEQP